MHYKKVQGLATPDMEYKWTVVHLLHLAIANAKPQITAEISRRCRRRRLRHDFSQFFHAVKNSRKDHLVLCVPDGAVSLYLVAQSSHEGCTRVDHYYYADPHRNLPSLSTGVLDDLHANPVLTNPQESDRVI